MIRVDFMQPQTMPLQPVVPDLPPAVEQHNPVDTHNGVDKDDSEAVRAVLDLKRARSDIDIGTIPGKCKKTSPSMVGPQYRPEVQEKEIPCAESVLRLFKAADKESRIPNNPTELRARFQDLLTRYPPSQDIMRTIDDISLTLHCPPPLIYPRQPNQRKKVHHPLYAYSVHAPPVAARHVSRLSDQFEDLELPKSTLNRYLRMGKHPRCQFKYYPPPTRPSSRAAAHASNMNVHRSKSPPPALVAALSGGDGSGAELSKTRVCGCCGGPRDVKPGATKVRYCTMCEKLRWQLRQRTSGGRVQNIRDAILKIGIEAGIDRILEIAVSNAAHNRSGDVSSEGGDATTGHGRSGARSSPIETTGTPPRTEAIELTIRNPLAGGGSKSYAGKVAGGGSEKGKPVDFTVRGDSHILKSKSSSHRQNHDDKHGCKSASRPSDACNADEKARGDATAVNRDCDFCRAQFQSTSGATLCPMCEDLKLRAKASGYTASELKKGISAGYIFPQSRPEPKEIRVLLSSMMLGKPPPASLITVNRADRRLARERSNNTPENAP